MPSIKTISKSSSTRFLSKTIIALFCGSLIACGGGSGTTRVSEDTNTETKPPVTKHITVSTHIPMHIQNGKLEIFVIGESKPIYSNPEFDGFGVSVTDVASSYRDRIIHVKLTGNDKTIMYDPILNGYVSFKGEMNAINTISDKLILNLTPASEAIYQRSLIRSGNFDLTKPDLSLVQAKHIKKSISEVNSSLSNAFNTPNLPEISNSLSVSFFTYNKANPRNYINTFVGLGLLKLWMQKYPDSQNTYLDLATNISIDLRDGYLDGRTIVGDSTHFLPLVNAPKNTDPLLNTLLDIGTTQQQTRETFGEALKEYTLAYANGLNLQNPQSSEGINALKEHKYFTDKINNNSSRIFRWEGAGDYRPAIGISTTAQCQGISVLPCKQGLNADDMETNYSDIEYLIGTHQVGSCTIKMLPSGDVELRKENRIIRGQINRDITDNLLQLENATNHYLLNIGAGEVRPPSFIQIELKNAKMISAQSGSANDFYPTKLTTTDISCN